MRSCTLTHASDSTENVVCDCVQLGATETLESNLANITVKKFEMEHDVDPLFHKVTPSYTPSYTPSFTPSYTPASSYTPSYTPKTRWNVITNV